MTTVARVYIEHPDLALTPTIRATPEGTIRVVSRTGTDPEHATFPFLVTCQNWGAFESALERDHTVASFDRVAAEGDSRLYQISHTDETELLTPKTTEVGGIMVEAESSYEGWLVELRLPDHEALHAIWEYASDRGFQFDLIEVYQETDDADEGPFGLTDRQRETLLMAYERGYFEQPRETSLEELAGELGVSQTAVSGLLRRGIERLIEATLFVEE